MALLSSIAERCFIPAGRIIQPLRESHKPVASVASCARLWLDLTIIYKMPLVNNVDKSAQYRIAVERWLQQEILYRPIPFKQSIQDNVLILFPIQALLGT